METSPITFHAPTVVFVLADEPKWAKWLAMVAASHNQAIEELSVVFMTDEELLAMNRQYLQHDYYTDILTFDQREFSEEDLMGDLYISIERVRENAADDEVPFETELTRVMAHGLLHLIGLDDKTDADTVRMRIAEEAAIALHSLA